MDLGLLTKPVRIDRVILERSSPRDAVLCPVSLALSSHLGCHVRTFEWEVEIDGETFPSSQIVGQYVDLVDHLSKRSLTAMPEFELWFDPEYGVLMGRTAGYWPGEDA